MVEEVPEGVEFLLLPGAIGRGRPRCPALQGPVHPLVTGVLFGMSRLDELGVNAQADPPDGEPGQSPQRGGGKGGAVVGTDDRGQSELAEEEFENGKGIVVAGGQESLAGEQVSGKAVGDGQGITVQPVAGLKVPLEIGSPDFIGFGHGGKRPTGMADLATPARRGDQPVSLEDVGSRADGGQFPVGMAFLNEFQEFFGSHVGMSPPGLEDCVFDLRRGGVGATIRTVRQLEESFGTFFFVPFDPFVAGFPADAEAVAQIGHGKQVQGMVGDEANFFIHR